MRLIRYADVAELIAKAETDAERAEAQRALALYYRHGRRESTAERMNALRFALLRAFDRNRSGPPRRHS